MVDADEVEVLEDLMADFVENLVAHTDVDN
jgi:hypothetical protein